MTERTGGAPHRRSLSTAEHRRTAIVTAAVRTFARTGYRGTPVSAVASSAGISEAYVFRLFGDKQSLFVAAVRFCFDEVREALAAGAAEVSSTDADAILTAMATAYGELIAERDRMMLQVHALAAADDPAIRAALIDCQRQLVGYVRERSGASGSAVQNFIARGQLYHFLTTLGLFGEFADTVEVAQEEWARVLTEGVFHIPPAGHR